MSFPCLICHEAVFDNLRSLSRHEAHCRPLHFNSNSNRDTEDRDDTEEPSQNSSNVLSDVGSVPGESVDHPPTGVDARMVPSFVAFGVPPVDQTGHGGDDNNDFGQVDEDSLPYDDQWVDDKVHMPDDQSLPPLFSNEESSSSHSDPDASVSYQRDWLDWSQSDAESDDDSYVGLEGISDQSFTFSSHHLGLSADLKGTMLAKKAAHSSSVLPNQPANLAMETISSLQLLAIMQRSNVPLRIYPEICQWAENTFGGKHLPSRSKILRDLAPRYHLDGLFPKEVSILLPYRKRQETVVVHDLEAVISSLLLDPSLMQPGNLLIDLLNPTAHPLPSNVCNDIDTGSVYTDGWTTHCTSPNDVLCGLMLFIDATHVDVHGHLGLEPVQVTLSIFNRETRARPEAWRVLGYIKKSSTQTAEAEDRIRYAVFQHNSPPLEVGVKGTVQDYHAVLSVVLSQTRQVQEGGGLSWRFSTDGPIVTLRLPILMIMGDTVGHDKLCCLRCGVGNPQCRYCQCPYEEMNNFKKTHRPTKMSRLKRLSVENKALLRRLGYYPLQNNPLYSLVYCDEVRGSNGCLPAEILHWIEHGLFDDGLGVFFNLLTIEGSQAIFTPTRIKAAHSLMREIGFHLHRQSDRNLPRTYFRSGYIPNKQKHTGQRTSLKRSGQEVSGVILVIILFLLAEDQHTASVRDRIGANRVDIFLDVFDTLLTFHAWLKQKSFLPSRVQKSGLYMRDFMERFVSQLGIVSLTRKKHYTVHFDEDILRFGSPLNYYGAIGESNFKYNTKNHARRTQRRAHVLDKQTAVRNTESIIIARGCAEAEHQTCGSLSFFWGGSSGGMSQERPPRQGARLVCRFKAAHNANQQRVVSVSFSPIGNLRKTELAGKWRSHDLPMHVLEEYLCEQLFPLLSSVDTSSVMLFTEATRGVNRYKAHPFLETAPCHNWCYVDTLDHGKIPCHLLIFFEVSGLKPDARLPHCLTNELLRDGRYALVHYLLEDPLAAGTRSAVVYGNDDDHYSINQFCQLVKWSCKCTNYIDQGPDFRRHLGRIKPLLAVVSLDSITDTCIAIPVRGSIFPFTYHFIQPRSHWPTLFDNVADQFATERAISINSSSSVQHSPISLFNPPSVVDAPPGVGEDSDDGDDMDNML